MYLYLYWYGRNLLKLVRKLKIYISINLFVFPGEFTGTILVVMILFIYLYICSWDFWVMMCPKLVHIGREDQPNAWLLQRIIIYNNIILNNNYTVLHYNELHTFFHYKGTNRYYVTTQSNFQQKVRLIFCHFSMFLRLITSKHVISKISSSFQAFIINDCKVLSKINQMSLNTMTLSCSV